MIAIQGIIVDFYFEPSCYFKKQRRNERFVLFHSQNGESCSQYQMFGVLDSFHRKFVSWVSKTRFDDGPKRGFK